MIDHIEVRVSNPEKFASTIVGLFGGEILKVHSNLFEIHFVTGPFLEIKTGDPNPADECTRALSRLAFSITDTEAMLPHIRQVDPEAKDLGWINLTQPKRRIVQFSVGNVMCHTIERQ